MGRGDLLGAYHASVLAALVTAAWALQRNGYDLRLDDRRRVVLGERAAAREEEGAVKI